MLRVHAECPKLVSLDAVRKVVAARLRSRRDGKEALEEYDWLASVQDSGSVDLLEIAFEQFKQDPLARGWHRRAAARADCPLPRTGGTAGVPPRSEAEDIKIMSKTNSDSAKGGSGGKANGGAKGSSGGRDRGSSGGNWPSGTKNASGRGRNNAPPK